MKTTKKYFGMRALSALSLLAGSLFFVACSQDDATRSPEQAVTSVADPTYTETIELPLEATMNLEDDGTLRALDAKVDNTLNARNQHGITLPDEFPVTIVIKNNVDKTYVHHVTSLKAKKTATGYKVDANDRIKLTNAPALTAQKTWYYMIIAGGAYNNTTKKLSVDASGDEAVNGATLRAQGGKTKMDFVMATPWIQIPRHANGYPKWRKEGWTTAEANQMKSTLYPLGVICRATLRLDDNYKTNGAVASNTKTAVRVKELRVVTTALSFKGEFDLSSAKLPAVTAKGRPALAWKTTQAPASPKVFPATNAKANEFVKVFRSTWREDDAVLSVEGNSHSKIFASDKLPNTAAKKVLPEGVQALVFWGMPVETKLNAEQINTVLIAQTGTSSDKKKILPPDRTYIYGKTHGKPATSGKSIYFDGIYYHPHSPLVYMAVHNMARNNAYQWKVNGTVPNGISNVFAADHKRSASTMAKISEVKKDGKSLVNIESGGRTYKLPTLAQWQSIIPVLNTNEKAPINVTMRKDWVRRADAEIETTLGKVTKKSRYYARKAQGSEVMYAMALVNFDGNNKHRVAYRYQVVPIPGTPPLMPSAQGLRIPYKGGKFAGGVNAKGERQDFGSVENNNVCIKIESVYLGEHFPGSADDVAKEVFWTATPASAKTVRYLSMNYDFFQVETSEQGGFYFNETSALLYAFLDRDDIIGVYSRVPNAQFATYGWKVAKPNGKPYVNESESKTRQRLNHMRVAVRPFTTEDPR